MNYEEKVNKMLVLDNAVKTGCLVMRCLYFRTYTSVDRFFGSPVAKYVSALCHCLGSTE
jgi:hypothetical protein